MRKKEKTKKNLKERAGVFIITFAYLLLYIHLFLILNGSKPVFNTSHDELVAAIISIPSFILIIISFIYCLKK